MADLVAIVYPTETHAAEVIGRLKELQKQYLIELADVCYVTRDKESGDVQLHQSINLTATGAASGALWGTLIGMLFLSPLAGAAVGAAAGAVSGYFSDFGIDDKFMKEVGQRVQPGRSAVFMLIRKATMDKVEPELAKFGGEVLYTNLSMEDEARLAAELAGRVAPAPAIAPSEPATPTS